MLNYYKLKTKPNYFYRILFLLFFFIYFLIEVISQQVVSDPPIDCPTVSTHFSEYADCNLNNGNIYIYVTTDPFLTIYNYEWTNVFTNQIIPTSNGELENVAAGLYAVEISDNYGCSSTYLASIDENSIYSIDSIYTLDANCLNNGEGSIIVDILYNSPSIDIFEDFTFTYSGPESGTITLVGSIPENFEIPNLLPGLYNIEITNGAGCSIYVSNIEIEYDDEVNDLAYILSTNTEQSCGFTDYEIFTNITNGTPPYNYLLYNLNDATLSSSGVIPQNQFLFDDLSAGNYIITLNDSNNCQVDSAFTINDSADVAINPDDWTISQPGCFGNFGTVQSPSILQGTYHVLNASGSLVEVINLPSVNYSLPAGEVYFIELLGQNCITSFAFEINEAIELLNFKYTLENAALVCAQFGIFEPGSLNIYYQTGGNGNATFTIFDPVTSTYPAANDLSIGFYEITLTDSEGCFTTNTIQIGLDDNSADCIENCASVLTLGSILGQSYYYADDIIYCSGIIADDVKLFAGAKSDDSEFIELQSGFFADGSFLFEAINIDCDVSDN